MTPPTPLHQSRRLGAWTIHAIQAGGQKLDGGAMFGVVPKTLWERRIPADARNRIPLGMRCLLVEHERELVLIDTGAGNKEDAKFVDIYCIENAGSPTALEDGVRAAGFTPEQVTVVINTHLHFDHAGGNTVIDAEGALRPAFPNARYVVQAGEYAFAMKANERTAASYFPRNYQPLLESGQMELVEGDREIVAGISALRTPGHTPHHQSVLLHSAGETACYFGDVVPTAAHLPLPWIMGYDVEPLVTLESKRWLLDRARREEWLVMFEHDASVAWGRVGHDGKSYMLTDG
jgi:glyoxylase-like metal-dependent hydrolase (beta-lactamase superfamily II)